MRKECSESEAYYKAEAYCSIAERCESEVRMKLQQWGVPQTCWDKFISRLTADNYISSSRYVDTFVREKCRFNKWGKQKIVQALKMKRLPNDVIENAMRDIDREEYISNLISLLQRKMKEVKAQNEYERNGKLIRFALGRGFEMNDILYCLKQIGCGDEYME